MAEVAVDVSEFMHGSRKAGMPGLLSGKENDYLPSAGQLMLNVG